MKEPTVSPEAVSVIVAVYNHFNWLRLILDALRSQTVSGFEVVIADDGSNAETVAAIKEYTARHPALRIIHSWQPDNGWQKDISLNKAVRASSGELLIFIDGDCVPHPKFVGDHLCLARRGRVVGGRRVDMGERLSSMVERWESLPTGYFRIARRVTLGSMFRQPFSETLAQLRRTVRYPFLSWRPFGVRNTGFLGCNFSIFRTDLERVNGFDERYLDPGTGEDTDLDTRLENAGIGHVKVSHYALMLHRRHPRLVFDSPRNEALYRSAKENGTTWVETGLFPGPQPK